MYMYYMYIYRDTYYIYYVIHMIYIIYTNIYNIYIHIILGSYESPRPSIAADRSQTFEILDNRTFNCIAIAGNQQAGVGGLFAVIPSQSQLVWH